MLKFLLSTGFLCALGVAAAAEENDGLSLPKGFKAIVVHEGVGPARHVAVRDNGDVYVMTQQSIFGPYDPSKNKGIVAMRDTDGDHVADRIETFGKIEGTGIQFYKGMLYVSDNAKVYRFAFEGDELVPASPPEVIVEGFGEERQHADKPFAFDGDGRLYVNVGAPSNACQERERASGSKGISPCPLLEKFGGVWRFDAEKPGQDQSRDGYRYASGLRNAVALEWHDAARRLYVVVHGRDQIDTLWPKLYDAKDNATRIAEEMLVVEEGKEHGWPYTFFDLELNRRVVAPEYGGDGKALAVAGKYPEPIVAFPAHWAPDDIVFYRGDQFPAAYRGGAFIAFHGSWNRAPEPQDGYNVVFQPLDAEGKPSGEWTVFADGFTRGPIKDNNPGNAAHRPVGLAISPDGALYISDSEKGRIWRIEYDAK